LPQIAIKPGVDPNHSCLKSVAHVVSRILRPSKGLGATWTTLHLGNADRVAEVPETGLLVRTPNIGGTENAA
jgi:hypothetical protein